MMSSFSTFSLQPNGLFRFSFDGKIGTKFILFSCCNSEEKKKEILRAIERWWFDFWVPENERFEKFWFSFLFHLFSRQPKAGFDSKWIVSDSSLQKRRHFSPIFSSSRYPLGKDKGIRNILAFEEPFIQYVRKTSCVSDCAEYEWKRMRLWFIL